MTDYQVSKITAAIYCLVIALSISLLGVIWALCDIKKAIKELKPTMQITQNPTTVKVVDGPRPTGLLPEVKR